MAGLQICISKLVSYGPAATATPPMLAKQSPTADAAISQSLTLESAFAAFVNKRAFLKQFNFTLIVVIDRSN